MKKKVIHLEVIRIFALFCIVYNHIGYDFFRYTEDKFIGMLSLVSSVICKIGVPLFFMISGALLLGKEESWSVVYKKRVMRIAKIIVLFTVIRFLYECYVAKSMEFSAVYLVKSILTGNLLHPYWFLYAYLSILLILPILRIVIKNLDQRGQVYLTALIAVFYVLIPLKIFFVNQEWPVTLLIDENICYLFLGHFIEHGLDRKHFNSRNMFLTLGAVVASVALSVCLVVRPYLSGGEYARELIPILSMPIACAVFYLVRAFSLRLDKKENVFAGLIACIGSCVFGVYLIEDYLRTLLAWVYGKMKVPAENLGLNIFSTFLVVTAGCVLVYFMKKLPILKRLI